MGFLDKAKDALGKHDDKVDQGIEKAGDAADSKFGGHEDKVDQAQDFLQERTGEGDQVDGGEGGSEGGSGEGEQR